MSPATRRVVLDASALLAWLNKERGAETVAQVLQVAVVPASALIETLYRSQGRLNSLSPTEIHSAIRAMGVAVEPVIEADCLRAAELIADSRRAATQNGGSLSLGDGQCLAVAERLNLPVTASDDLWESLNLAVGFLPFR